MGESGETALPTLDSDAIEQTCSEVPVTLAVVYGSHARGEATANSDVDVAVAFEESLSSVERTQARLDLIERLRVALDADVDVVPLSQAADGLLAEIGADGVVVYGSPAALDAYERRDARPTTHEDRLAEFDSLLADLERVV